MQLEDVLRQTKPHKATGYDQLPSVLFRNHACDLAEAFFPLVAQNDGLATRTIRR